MHTRAVHDLETGRPDGPRRDANGVPGAGTSVSEGRVRGEGPGTPGRPEVAGVIRPAADGGATGATGPKGPVGAVGEGGANGATPSDGWLVEQVRRGDPRAFDQLVRRHDRRAFSLAFRLLSHREDAEDVVQESFIAALEALDRFDATRPFGPWFYRIVVNRSLNARKARSRRSMEAIPEDAPARTASPERAVEVTEAKGQVTEALASLSERQRAVVEMIELEGFSGPEVAEILGIPEGTVRWHLHGARKALRAALGPAEGGSA